MTRTPFPPTVIDRIPERLLLGPGPSNSPDSIRNAAAQPLLGHLDPLFSDLLEELRDMLRTVFQTNNPVTYAVSGTGSAGMETLAVNLFEPGDTVLVGRNGIFGGRLVDALERLGVHAVPVEAEWGEPITVAAVDEAWTRHPEACALWLVHAETSTGLHQPELDVFSQLAHDRKGLFLVDCVTSLGGVPLKVDAWGIDAAFSGTQKCLNVTPGLAPITLGHRALAKIKARTTRVPSWYFDLESVMQYWEAQDGKRVYHHTAPIASLYALHEGLRLILEEGLENCWERHARSAQALQAALEAFGFRYRVPASAHRLPMLHAVGIPSGWNLDLRKSLLADDNIEIGAALGTWAADTWRIGLMGCNADPAVILRLVEALARHYPEAGKKALGTLANG